MTTAENQIQIVAASFADVGAARSSLRELRDATRSARLTVQSAALIRKNAEGKLEIFETADMSGRRGAALGGVAGAAIGLVAGSALFVPALLGAVIGGSAAMLLDTGFVNDRLGNLGRRLTENSLALVAVVESASVDALTTTIAPHATDLVTDTLAVDLATEIERGHDVIYAAVAADDGVNLPVSTARPLAVVLDDTGRFGSRFRATPSGIAVDKP